MAESPPTLKVHPTYNILEATDATEYAALSTAQKALYALIVSAGTVNFTEGSSVVSKLYDMFPEGTTTRTNLAKLL